MYCMVPVDRLTDEMVRASTAGTIDYVVVTPEGRAVLRYRTDAPSSASRFVTRADAKAAREWLDARSAPNDISEYHAAMSVQRTVARDKVKENSRTP